MKYIRPCLFVDCFRLWSEIILILLPKLNNLVFRLFTHVTVWPHVTCVTFPKVTPHQHSCLPRKNEQPSNAYFSHPAWWPWPTHFPWPILTTSSKSNHSLPRLNACQLDASWWDLLFRISSRPQYQEWGQTEFQGSHLDCSSCDVRSPLHKERSQDTFGMQEQIEWSEFHSCTPHHR
jgi:hypothetical protein